MTRAALLILSRRIKPGSQSDSEHFSETFFHTEASLQAEHLLLEYYFLSCSGVG